MKDEFILTKFVLNVWVKEMIQDINPSFQEGDLFDSDGRHATPPITIFREVLRFSMH